MEVFDLSNFLPSRSLLDHTKTWLLSSIKTQKTCKTFSKLNTEYTTSEASASGQTSVELLYFCC